MHTIATTARAPAERAQRALARAARDRRAQLAAGAVAATGVAAVAGGIARRTNGGTSVRAYRFKVEEKPAKGVRKIAIGRIDDALEQLREHPDGKGTAVHEARKDLKKLRSLLRLARGELGKSTYRTENGRYRDAGRLLSDLRDADVKLATLAALTERFGDLSGLDEYRSRLERDHARQGEHRDEALAAVAQSIDRGRERVEHWDLPKRSWSPAGEGLERSYRRGREAFKGVLENPSDETAHEWRKRSKDLWYHLRLLRPAWPAVLEPLADEAHELSDLLGDHHDLAVLAADARAHEDCFADSDREALLGAIEGRQRELLEQAVPLGWRLYAEKPKAFTARMAGYWAARTAAPRA
jgi:CHAD domain-containing protein